MCNQFGHKFEMTGDMPTNFHNKGLELYFQGIVHYEFVPTGQTVNQVYYLEILKRLREEFRRKRPELQQLIYLASRQCTLFTGPVCEGVFSYKTNNCVGTPCLFTGSSPQ